jgi:hypothetical protein
VRIRTASLHQLTPHSTGNGRGARELAPRPSRFISLSVALVQAQIEMALASVLAHVPDAEVRLVGTASSMVRGIDLPANDVDVLFRQRADVDAWFNALTGVVEVDTAPVWLADAYQYFARVRVHGIVVELSTVENECEHDTVECLGEGPWRHCDVLECDGWRIAAVATELRLITEVSRGRTDRYRPIIGHLQVAGCDAALLRRGLDNAGVASEQADALLRELSVSVRLDSGIPLSPKKE